MHAIVSIHDVMPNTLGRVLLLLEKMQHLENRHITLLIVPGLDWTKEHLDTLHRLEEEQYTFAGHGWEHTTRHVSGFYHRFHSAFISRNAAEHLSLTRGEIKRLMEDCYQWFKDNSFTPPDMYVPPAWAMGSISNEDLTSAPFRYFENTSGFIDSESGRQLTLPLVGFEADNAIRSISLALWNGLNKILGSRKRPVRVSIHPYDTELLLQKALEKTLQNVTNAVDYHTLFNFKSE